YHWPVKINVVEGQKIRPMVFSQELFSYGKNDFKRDLPPEMGFSGFRIHYPLNTKNYYDEVIAFLGASYFRAVAAGQQYGISARGLALDTALSSGEEFPFFKEFWILKPSATAKEITVYALLDSPRVAGAYEFVIHPGKETAVAVT